MKTAEVLLASKHPKSPSAPESTLIDGHPTLADTEDADLWVEVDELLLGKRFKATYDVEDIVARGRLTSVYRAVQRPIDREVAIKFLRPDLASDTTYRERFFREIRVLGKLTHPNIVTFIDGGETDAGHLFLVTEFLRGKCLEDVVREQGLPFKAVDAIVQQVCAAAGEAHRLKLIHRDLNPDNVFLLDTRGVVPTVKVLDFGLAKPLQDGEGRRVTAAIGAQLGTAGFVAPEQVSRPDRVDERADVYSIGALLYFLLNGVHPYGKGDDESVWERQRKGPPEDLEVPGHYPAGLDKVLARALAHDPNERFQSAHALAEAVARCRPVAGENADPSDGWEGLTESGSGWGEASTANQVPTLTSFEMKEGEDAAHEEAADEPARASPRPVEMDDGPLAFTPAPGEALASTEPSRVVPPELHSGSNINLILGLLTLGIALVAVVLAAVFLMPNKGKPTVTQVVEIPPQAYVDASGVAGITETTIVVSVPAAADDGVGAALRTGVGVRFQEENAAGGVQRRQLKLDAAGPALADVGTLVEGNRVFAFLGSADPNAVLQAAQQWPRVLFVSPYTGLETLHTQPPLPNVFHLRPALHEEVGALLIHLVNKLGVSPRRLAVVHDTSITSQSALAGCLNTLRDYNITAERVLQVPTTSADVGQASARLLDARAQVDAVIALVDRTTGVTLVEQLRDKRFKVPIAFLSNVGSRMLVEALERQGKRLSKEVFISEVVPPVHGDLPGVLRYRNAMTKFAASVPLDTASLEGYLGASVLIEAMKKVQGGLTNATVVKSLESVSGLDLGVEGTLDYGATDHDGLRKIWVTELSKVDGPRAGP